jgi:hypothetical protein
MPARYEPIDNPRFTIAQTPEGEQIRIKPRRQIFLMLFLPIWLAAWTAGGVAAIYAISTRFEPFLLVWLCGWAVGWIFAAGTLVWMAAGAETLRMIGPDLEIGHHILGVSRRWLYQGSQIRRLSAAAQPGWPYNYYAWQLPFSRRGRFGSIKFDYGARTIYAAPGLDEAEGAMIVTKLAKRLPPTARRAAAS